MTDNNSIERVETSKRRFQSDDLTLMLARKLQELEDEIDNMRNLARLSIFLDTLFRENMDNPINTTLTTLADHLPSINSTSQVQIAVIKIHINEALMN